MRFGDFLTSLPSCRCNCHNAATAAVTVSRKRPLNSVIPQRNQNSFVPPSPPPAPIHRPPGYDQALEFLYGRIDYERANRGRNNYRFRLRCTAELFERLGLGRYLYARPGREDRSEQRDASSPPDGAPDNTPPVPLVHIAGTKGKGSTATMVGAILAAAGRRVGLYTSPHLTDLEERFRINGQPCSRETLVDLVRTVRPVVEAFEADGDPVSFFELTTAMAVLHFDRSGCDAIVLEVGLGGRLDSTNVCNSTVSAITSIGLDHQHVLGNTIAEIAAEKAGIIKPGIPVVCGATKPDAIATIAAIADTQRAPLFLRGDAFAVRQVADLGLASEMGFHPLVDKLVDAETRAGRSDGGSAEEAYLLSLAGSHQVENAALAIAIARLLGRPERPEPIPIASSVIAAALRSVRCLGRVERFAVGDPATADQPPVQVIVDTAHNEDSIAALCHALRVGRDRNDAPTAAGSHPRTATASPKHSDSRCLHPLHRPLVVVWGTSRDKDAAVMASQLAKVADQVVCTRYTTNPRAYEPQTLAECFAGAVGNGGGPLVRCQAEPFLALREAIHAASPGGTVVVCGSFFLAGQLRPLLLTLPGVRPVHFDGGVNHSSDSPGVTAAPRSQSPANT